MESFELQLTGQKRPMVLIVFLTLLVVFQASYVYLHRVFQFWKSVMTKTQENF